MENSEYCDWIKCIFSLQMATDSNSSTQGSPGDLELKHVFSAHVRLVIGTVIVVIVLVLVIFFIIWLFKVIFKKDRLPEAAEDAPPDSPTSSFYTPPSSPDPWLVPMVPMTANTAPSAPTPPTPPPNPGPWVFPVLVVTFQ